jgi:anti-sigma B factor antagonist
MTPYTVQFVDSIPVVILPPRIDSVTSADLEKTIKSLIGENNIIICDFSNNTYISSLGLRVLLSSQKELKKTKGYLALCSLSPYVQGIFDISGFTRIFSISLSHKEAVESIRSAHSDAGTGLS